MRIEHAFVCLFDRLFVCFLPCESEREYSTDSWLAERSADTLPTTDMFVLVSNLLLDVCDVDDESKTTDQRYC